ncbi:MAG: hypothetical protein GWN01_01245 [Nitrosopumilaceae archaeon]|nr:hypothetical protein [Nitrosopumilaceae archaeon]NIU85985.1 hypothetical protein [Nitrosopumilaceae archaeon]NIX60204.1 hypothetical protein [Nitrosopumilaceae archaeon]
MVYEEYIMYPEAESPQAEYKTDELKIYYYLPNITGSIPELITHEWLHYLFDWGTEGAIHEEEKTNGDKDHFIMRIIEYC